MEFEVVETETAVVPGEAVDEIDEDLTARGACQIHLSGESGTDLDDEFRAEREPREERQSHSC